MLIIICAILVLFCRVSCVLPWTGRQQSCPHTWRCFNICDWCQLYPPYGVWHTTTDHVLPWQFALSYSEHMCSINKDSLFIERCFIILHANDRSIVGAVGFGIVWLFSFFVHFPCKCTLHVQCTVFIPASNPGFRSGFCLAALETKSGTESQYHWYGFVHVLVCYTREVHVTNVIVVPSIDRMKWPCEWSAASRSWPIAFTQFLIRWEHSHLGKRKCWSLVWYEWNVRIQLQSSSTSRGCHYQPVY